MFCQFNCLNSVGLLLLLINISQYIYSKIGFYHRFGGTPFYILYITVFITLQ